MRAYNEYHIDSMEEWNRIIDHMEESAGVDDPYANVQYIITVDNWPCSKIGIIVILKDFRSDFSVFVDILGESRCLFELYHGIDQIRGFLKDLSAAFKSSNELEKYLIGRGIFYHGDVAFKRVCSMYYQGQLTVSEFNSVWDQEAERTEKRKIN